MDLPLPVLPIMAVVFPGSAVKLISSKISVSASGYLNETFLNSTNPFLFGSNFFVSFLSLILGSASITSLILLAETAALGSMIEIIDIIKNAITICIVYWINAIISPTCITPWSTLWPPTQTINIIIAFIININKGIIIDIALLTNKFVFIKSLFAASNLASSFFSLLNALITGKPVRISLETSFNLSIKSCNFLNLGIAIANKVATIINMATIATPIIHAIELSVLVNTLTNPPTPIIGAYTTTLNSMVINCCICCTSLVLRVINDAVENWFNSAFENVMTFLKTFSLNVFPSFAATLDDNNIMVTAHIMVISAIPNICNPVLKI